MNMGGTAPLILDAEPVKELSVADYNVKVVNSISYLYPGFRQDSKAP